MVNLFTTFYREKDPERAKELLHCLQKNIACNVIDRIYLLVEKMPEIPDFSPKVIPVHIGERPSYNDFFYQINRFSAPSDINIIANTDIFFKDDLGIIKKQNLYGKCFALTRYDITENDESDFLGRVDSQDTWIFKGKINNIKADFLLGSLGCDNKIAYVIQKAGYKITNPSLDLKSYHLHISQYRPGLSAFTASPLPGPYLYLPITRLESLFISRMKKILGIAQVKRKNNNFLMHRLYVSWLDDMISSKNKDLFKQLSLLAKCFFYKPALNRKYLRFYYQKLLKPALKLWLSK